MDNTTGQRQGASAAKASKLKRLIANWNSPYRRPLWKIALLVPLWLLYVPARAFVDWADRHV